MKATPSCKRLQGKLDKTRTLARAAGQAGVDRLEAALSGFIGDAEALNGAMQQIDVVVHDTARGFDAAGRELPQRLGQATLRLEGFRAALDEVGTLSVMLRLRRATMAEPDLPFAEGSPEAAVLADLRSRYTMAQERDIHDAVTGAGMVRLQSVAPPQAVQDETLDDILF